MMPDLGKYAFAVLGSYGVALAAIAGMVVWSVLRDRRVQRQLRSLEARRGKDG